MGNNPFTIAAYNGNCEVNLDNTATIVVRTPEVIVSVISGNTSENGTTATFTIRLNTEPTANVTIGLSSNDMGEGTVSPASLLFTPANYGT
jgi:type 1 fimbria pilin